jgi:hypothetical protein
VTQRTSSALTPTLVFLPSTHPSNLTLKSISLIEKKTKVLPVLDNAVVEQNTSDNLDHLSDGTMPADHGLFDTRSFVDFGRIADYCIA